MQTIGIAPKVKRIIQLKLKSHPFAILGFLDREQFQRWKKSIRRTSWQSDVFNPIIHCSLLA